MYSVMIPHPFPRESYVFGGYIATYEENPQRPGEYESVLYNALTGERLDFAECVECIHGDIVIRADFAGESNFYHMEFVRKKRIIPGRSGFYTMDMLDEGGIFTIDSEGYLYTPEGYELNKNILKHPRFGMIPLEYTGYHDVHEPSIFVQVDEEHDTLEYWIHKKDYSIQHIFDFKAHFLTEVIVQLDLPLHLIYEVYQYV